jgi:integrase
VTGGVLGARPRQHASDGLVSDATPSERRRDPRDVRLHDARHTAATLLLVQGVDIRTVMSIMGWTEMATAQRYTHAVDELRRRAARQMGALLWDEQVGR